VDKAVANINEALAEVVIGMDAYDQAGIDMAMIEADGTENKSKLGLTPFSSFFGSSHALQSRLVYPCLPTLAVFK